ncbi:MAG: hypothetical protein LUD68_06275 [Rikenellaceae bacterium]|nr:hypothetical protein [Rikenellaceae bacterium]
MLPRPIDRMERIVLGHKNKVFSVDFAVIDYTASERIKYVYRLEGFDPDWIYADKQRTAGYMNLPPRRIYPAGALDQCRRYVGGQ